MLLGFTGKDYTIIAASKAAMRGATILKASDDKTRQLNKTTLMAFTGEAGDTSMILCSLSPSLSLSLSTPYLDMACSTIRRIHPSQHPALLYAKRCRACPIGSLELCARRASSKPAVEKPIYREFTARRNGSDYESPTSLLD